MRALRGSAAELRAALAEPAAAVLGLCAAAVFLLGAAGCDDGPEFTSPGLGDFVQATEPADGEVLTADKFGRGAVVLQLNFFAAEDRFGFGQLRAFRFDGDDVADQVEIFPGEGTPPATAVLSYRADDVDQGAHSVEVEYTDSRGVVHRVRWTFRIES